MNASAAVIEKVSNQRHGGRRIFNRSTIRGTRVAYCLLSIAMTSKTSPLKLSILLAICQCFYLSASSVGLSFSGLVGASLAENKAFATLPYTVMTLATAISTLFASRLMNHYGRRAGFVLGSLFGLAGGLLSMESVLHREFALFCLGAALLGLYQAFAQHYRYAAADNAPAADKGTAISYVLLGGVAAAVIGPFLARQTRDLFAAQTFAGSYLGVAGLAALSVPLLMTLKVDKGDAQPASVGTGRALREILAQGRTITSIACCAVGYATMIYVMTASPLAFVGCGYPVAGATSVIQWHLLAMFSPSLFTGRLVSAYGSSRIAFLGILLQILGACAAMAGTEPKWFYTALVLNGLGWNLMYVGGTAMLTESYRPEERAKVQGLNELITFGAVAIGAGLSGLVYKSSGWNSVNLSSLVILSLFLLLFVLSGHLDRKKKACGPEAANRLA